jgi:predicted flavoprotein YhiN
MSGKFTTACPPDLHIRSSRLPQLDTVMHDRTKPLSQILSSYPRGPRELRGTFTKRFTPEDAYDWFTSRGVILKTEADGRMFPITDDSRTIVDTISRAATEAGAELRMRQRVERVEWRGMRSGGGEEEGDDDDDDDGGGGRFTVTLSSRSSDDASSGRVVVEERFDAVILATGSFPMGHEIASSLGHTIVKPVPSLFTLDARDLVTDGGVFHGLAGVAVPWARLTMVVNDNEATSAPPSGEERSSAELADANADQTKKDRRRRKKKAITISQEGPLLITHHGVSGPAALRLSAFAAREFHTVGYRCEVRIHFCPKWEEERMSGKCGSGGDSILMDALWGMTRSIPKRRVSTGCPLFMKGMEASDQESAGDSPKSAPIIPKRLWSALVQHSEIPSDNIWGDVSKSMIRSLSNNLSLFPLGVTSKGIFKEEFVTAGGVHLSEVQMSNMQSKVTPGLFMCGEILDVDGVTGGFNFMGCWSTGYVAGEGAAKFCLDDQMKVGVDMLE